MTSDAPTTSVPTADTEAGTGLTRAEVIHLRGQLEPVPVNCRVRRRLGQHTIKRDGTAIGLDAYLALERAAGTDNRIPLTTEADPADLLQSLADKSSSPVVVRLFTDESPDHEATWLLDQDQLAGLLGHGWTTTPQEPRPLCCGPLAATHYQLSAPDLLPGTDAEQSDRAGRPLRDRLKDHATYGKVTNAPSCTTNPSFTAKPSHGSGSGTPGIELTEHQLTHLRAQANAPSLKFGDWIIVRRDFRSAVGPEQLRLPATLRERTATETHTCHRQHDCTPADIGVDQVIRLALGVGVWEGVTLEAVTAEKDLAGKPGRFRQRSRSWFDAQLEKVFPSVHVVARVQPAELTLTEQDACLLSPLALDSLGLKSGDEVIIHAAHHADSPGRTPTAGADGSQDPHAAGAPESTNASDNHAAGHGQPPAPAPVIHAHKPVKAYMATDEVIARRMRIYGGGRGAPLPDEEQGLQFGQALPWIWLDEALRDQLGLPNRLGAVVLAPSRRYALMDNLREIAIVIAIAFGGAAAGTKPPTAIILAAVALVVPVLLIASRIRSKLR